MDLVRGTSNSNAFQQIEALKEIDAFQIIPQTSVTTKLVPNHVVAIDVTLRIFNDLTAKVTLHISFLLRTKMLPNDTQEKMPLISGVVVWTMVLTALISVSTLGFSSWNVVRGKSISTKVTDNLPAKLTNVSLDSKTVKAASLLGQNGSLNAADATLNQLITSNLQVNGPFRLDTQTELLPRTYLRVSLAVPINLVPVNNPPLPLGSVLKDTNIGFIAGNKSLMTIFRSFDDRLVFIARLTPGASWVIGIETQISSTGTGTTSLALLAGLAQSDTSSFESEFVFSYLPLQSDNKLIRSTATVIPRGSQTLVALQLIGGTTIPCSLTKLNVSCTRLG